MEIRNPEYILTLAEARSITRAAELLYVSQSTLSQYLLKTEAEIGTQLFLRERTGLVPTEAGQIYLRAAADIRRICERAEGDIAALSGGGSLRIGLSSWGLRQVTALLPEFRAAFPRTALELYEEHYAALSADLRAERLDMAVTAVTPQDSLPRSGVTELCEEEILLVLPAALAEEKGLAQGQPVPERELPRLLENAGFILSDENSTVRVTEDALFRRLLFRPRVICELDSKNASLSMVEAGAGAAFVPAYFLDSRAAYVYGPGTQLRCFSLDPPLLRTEVLILREGLQCTGAAGWLAQRLIENSKKN